MSERRYSPFEVEAAMCVWEWLLDHSSEKPEDKEVLDLFESYGYGGMRNSAVQAGCIVVEAYLEYEKHLDYEDSFDWEFVPLICGQIDWQKLVDDNQYGDGKYSPDVKAMVATNHRAPGHEHQSCVAVR